MAFDLVVRAATVIDGTGSTEPCTADVAVTGERIVAVGRVQSRHGVTTVAMGNCGVGFVPARPDWHEWLINLLEGVEDIPGTSLSEGMTWGWESFGEYLDVLAARPRTLDVGRRLDSATPAGRPTPRSQPTHRQGAQHERYRIGHNTDTSPGPLFH